MTDLTLRAALEKCRDTFAEYAELHRRKLTARMGSTERNAVHRKIERNRDMADMCIAALEREPDEAMVERVALALCQNALGGKTCPCREALAFNCGDAFPGHQARAAIAAMKGTSDD